MTSDKQVMFSVCLFVSRIMQNLLDRFFFTKIGVKVQHKGHGKTHWIMVVTWIMLRYGYGRLGLWLTFYVIPGRTVLRYVRAQSYPVILSIHTRHVCIGSSR